MTKTKRNAILVRFTPEWEETGQSGRAVLTVTDRTTAAQVLRKLGLKRHVLLPGGSYPPIPGKAGVLDVELGPENVALAGADFVAITRAAAERDGGLRARLTALFNTGMS